MAFSKNRMFLLKVFKLLDPNIHILCGIYDFKDVDASGKYFWINLQPLLPSFLVLLVQLWGDKWNLDHTLLVSPHYSVQHHIQCLGKGICCPISPVWHVSHWGVTLVISVNDAVLTDLWISGCSLSSVLQEGVDQANWDGHHCKYDQ